MNDELGLQLPANASSAALVRWERQELFLAAFSLIGSVGAASIDTGIPVATVESWESHDTHGFKKRLTDAKVLVLGQYDREIHRRGIEGIDHPVIHQGVITDHYKQYSDNLLMFRAKRLDPEYRDNPPPVTDDSAKQALEAMTRAVVQFNQTNIVINQAAGSDNTAASIIDALSKPVEE